MYQIIVIHHKFIKYFMAIISIKLGEIIKNKCIIGKTKTKLQSLLVIGTVKRISR